MKGSYLNDEFFSRLETLSLELRADLAGFFGGKHLVKTYGPTVEFADYREYMLGDDIRRIDWNLYSRFEKYFLKLFTDERQMHTEIFIDCSASMGKVNRKKGDYAIAAAAAMVVGQNLVAGKVARVNKTLVIVSGFTLSITAIFCGAFLLFPNILFGLFNRDAAVLAIVPSYLPILALDFVALGLKPITRAIIDGSGNRKINLVNALLDAVVARIGFAFLFGVYLGMGYYGFWLGAALAAYVPILVGVVFYLTGVWKKAIKVQ